MLDPVEFGQAMGAIVKDAIAPLLKRIEELEARQPEKGEKGDPGQDAPPVEIDIADVVKELLAADGVKQYLQLEVDAYMEANPPAAGRDGKDGDPGPQGEKGEPGADGADGVGVAGAMIDRDGGLVVTLTNGEVKSLGVVVGRDGKDGKDGAGLVELVRSYDADAHEIVERWGEKELRYPAGGIRHGGYWREGTRAKAAETWTHAGVAWVAKRDTSDKPSRDSDDWEIFANKGRDGKDGANGRDLGPAPPVKLAGYQPEAVEGQLAPPPRNP